MIRMVRLLTRALLTIRELREAMQQQQVLMVYREGIDILNRQILEERRERLAMVNGWLLSIENPEIDIRDDLRLMARALMDEVAQMEEQVV
jgi:hypothetical protein